MFHVFLTIFIYLTNNLKKFSRYSEHIYLVAVLIMKVKFLLRITHLHPILYVLISKLKNAYIFVNVIDHYFSLSI